jgi:hypothetical protein
MDEELIRQQASLAGNLLYYRGLCQEHGYPLPDEVIDELAKQHDRCRYRLIPLLENLESLSCSIAEYLGKTPTCLDDMRLLYGRLHAEFHLPRHMADEMHPHHLHMLLVFRRMDDAEGLHLSLKQICSDKLFQEVNPRSFHNFCYAAEHMLIKARKRETDDRGRDVPGLAGTGGSTPQLALDGPTTPTMDARTCSSEVIDAIPAQCDGADEAAPKRPPEHSTKPVAPARTSDNDARDGWPYSQKKEGKKLKEILSGLTEIHSAKEWEPIETTPGITMAINRYAERKGLPKLTSAGARK